MELRTTRTRGRRSGDRRGSVIVLVAGILVLLVIVATAYLSRANAERATAAAQRTSMMRDDRADVLAEQLATQIAHALFVRPVDVANDAAYLLPPGNPNASPVPTSNTPRLPIAPDAVRYGMEFVTTGAAAAKPFYHGAPYQVVPWTNWPDGLIDPTRTPAGPREDDLAGNPGFSDTRWLRSTEPNRTLFSLGADGLPYTGDGEVEYFTHWTHMSYPPTPNNGLRLVTDISDVFDSNDDLAGRLLTDLSVPVEQWLPDVSPFLYDASLGRSIFPVGDPQLFWNRWGQWFTPGGYEAIYANNNQPPSNWYDLDNLNGNDIYGELGERPQDEFAGPGDSSLVGTPYANIGTPRWHVSRLLTDTDGDGYTDSYWYLVPSSVDGGVRQVMAVSVVDNSGMINVNTSTQFVRANPTNPTDPDIAGIFATSGATPVDVALFDLNGPGLSVGFFNNLENSEVVFPSGLPANHPASPYGTLEWGFNWRQWPDPNQAPNDPPTFLGELGFATADAIDARAERFDYWRRAGSRGLEAVGSFRPFTPSDELELRMYHGQNVPWAMSRLERAVETSSTVDSFMRADLNREETTPYLDQLRVRASGGFYFDELLHDRRRMMTTYSGARNDLLPPWLRWENRVGPATPLGTWGFPGFLTIPGEPPPGDVFLAQSRRKLDLRESPLFNQNVGSEEFLRGRFRFNERLPWALLLALSSRDAGGDIPDSDYFDNDDPSDDLTRTRRMAASMAANIQAYRDAAFQPDGTPIPAYVSLQNQADVVPVPLVGGRDTSGTTLPNVPGSYDLTTRYMGMEAQPFLVEAFIAHVYQSDFQVPPQYDNAGHNMIYEDDYAGTVVAVQIANPFKNRTLQLQDAGGIPLFELRVFGETFPLVGSIPPGEARVFLADGDFDENRWQDALNVEPDWDLDADLTNPNEPNEDLDKSADWGYQNVGVWETGDRAPYDTGNEEEAIELFRQVDDGTGALVPVLIDRIDVHANDDVMFPEEEQENFAFGEAVVELADTIPDPFPNGFPLGGTFPGLDLGPTNDRWLQFVHVTREWWDGDVSINGTVELTPDDEKAPRFVYAAREVTSGTRSFEDAGSPDDWLEATPDPADSSDRPKPTKFASKRKDPDESALEPDFVNNDDPFQMLQKDGDFEQLGELLNVWVFGHQLRFTGAGTLDTSASDHGTTITFSEFMSAPTTVGEADERVNRLRTAPRRFSEDSGGNGVPLGGRWSSRVVGMTSRVNALDVTNDATPSLPAGVRVLDLFVLDGPGWNAPVVDADGDGTWGLNSSTGEPLDPADFALLEFRNAGDFSGEPTYGLINVNTAPREVLRSLPHWYGLVHRTGLDDNGASQTPAVRTRVAEAVERYRDKAVYANAAMPTYVGRGINGSTFEYIDEMRPELGLASPAELTLLQRSGNSTGDDRWDDSWSIEFGGLNPYRSMPDDQASPPLLDVDVSTDLAPALDAATATFVLDETAEDAEERNLLYAGASNLITTTSDTFTVYFKVRSFKQNPTTGVWDATDPAMIVDESRYVMLVDRSRVNSPGDEPRILYFEKITE